MTRREPKQMQADISKRTASSHALNRRRVRKQIKLVCGAIAAEFHPDRIVLFGSHAYGNPRPESDVDLLVVMPFEGSPFRQASVILGHVVQVVGIVPMDLVVRTASRYRKEFRWATGLFARSSSADG